MYQLEKILVLSFFKLHEFAKKATKTILYIDVYVIHNGHRTSTYRRLQNKSFRFSLKTTKHILHKRINILLWYHI